MFYSNYKENIYRICTRENQSMLLGEKNKWNTKEGSESGNEGQNKYKIDYNDLKMVIVSPSV